MKESYQ